jgi:hypothetical protein
MRPVALLVLSACWTGTPATEQTAPPLVTASVDRAGDASWYESRRPSSVVRRPKGYPLISTWEGTYRCTQGLTAVRMRIEATPFGDATAVFEFGPVPSNPTVPNGSFKMVGTIKGTEGRFEAAFQPADWIVRPPTYTSVALTIETDSHPRSLRGVIDSRSCSDFKVERVD